MAMLDCRVGENVPEVTWPTCWSPANTMAPLPGDPFAVEDQARSGWPGACFLAQQARPVPTKSPLSSLTAQPTPGRVRVDRLGKLVAVERHRGLEPQAYRGHPARTA